MFWTISPAPGLIIGSVVVVLVNKRLAGAISVAILLGAIIYLVEALVIMLALLLDATDPSRFKAMLLRKAKRAAKKYKPLQVSNPPLIDPEDIAKMPVCDRRRARARQRTTDELYAICPDRPRLGLGRGPRTAVGVRSRRQG